MWEAIVAGLCLLIIVRCMFQGIMKHSRGPQPATEEQAHKNIITMANDGLHNTIACVSVCSGLIYWFLQANTGYFVLYLFFCQSIYVVLVQILKKGMDKNNYDNTESVKSHIWCISGSSTKIRNTHG